MIRRLSLVAAVLLALVALPATAAALSHPSAARDGVQPCTRAAAAGACGVASPSAPREASFTPLGVTLLRMTVAGHGRVDRYDASGIAGARVLWGLDIYGLTYSFEDGEEDTTEYLGWIKGGTVKTAADGSFSFSNSGMPNVDYWTDYDEYYDYLFFDATYPSELSSGLTDRLSIWLCDTAAGSYTLAPGHVPYQLTRKAVGPYETSWQYARIVTSGSKGGASTWVGSESGVVNAMVPDVQRACVDFWSNVGLETYVWSPVQAYAQSNATITADENDAYEIHVVSPKVASGKPGCTAKVELDNWPEGLTARFYGYSESPSGAGYRSWRTSYTLPLAGPVSLVVPAKATPGYFYGLHVYPGNDENSLLDLVDYVQVCTLKPSAARINHGGSVRLSGIVPTQGHWGSKRGLSKTVVLYQSTRSRPQPTSDAVPTGWKKVQTFKANGLGKYVSKLLRPRRTTWYVLHYAGDDEYWPAWTSVAKVTVR